MNLNRLTLIGRITADPELKKARNGKSYTRFCVATTEFFNGPDGRKENTEFHQCVAWEMKAENICKYVKKGQGILVEGPVRTSTYTDKDDVKRSISLLNVFNVQFGTRSKSTKLSDSSGDESGESPESADGSKTAEEGLDLPF
jgi:single-strand DNA-binding protein